MQALGLNSGYRELVVIGASAGGVEALSKLVAMLPSPFPAAICIVMHVPADGASVLPHILGRRCDLPVTHATDGESLKPGHIYIAPADRHFRVEYGRV